jgi:hypothetical protein
MNGHNGDFTYGSTQNALLEFFAKAGSLFVNKKGKRATASFYGSGTEATALQLFKPAWSTNSNKAMKLAMWVRDARGGAGNRSGFREIIEWISNEDPKWMEANMHMIPLVGRWDDLKALVGTPCEASAIEFWVAAITEGEGLAAKWAPREKNDKDVFHKLRRVAKLSPKDFRKLLVANTHVVETAMCSKDFHDIDYSKVPSVAMARYNNAFGRNDTARFDGWKSALEKGVDDEGNEVKVNAGALFPHDLIRTLYADLSDRYGGYYGFSRYDRHGDTDYKDSELVNAQFEALPDFLEGTDQRIMTLADFSASMTTTVSGSITAMDVAMGLGLYCSDRLGKENPFYRRFMPFSSDSHMVCWEDDSFSVAAQKYNDGYVGSTNIEGALNKLLEAAVMFKATDEQIPNVLMVVSDMQFNQGARGGDQTVVESCMKRWEDAGYTRPRIVYWNTAGYAGDPATKSHDGVGLVSGFSPSILKAVLGGDDFTPMAIMDRALEKYEIVEPA